MSMVKTRGMPAAQTNILFYPHGGLLFFGCRSGLGLKGRIGGQGALATGRDPDKVSPQKWGATGSDPEEVGP